MESKQLIRGQVIVVYKERYLVSYEEKKIMATVSGRFQYTHYLKSEYPQIGDYVTLRMIHDNFAIIEGIQTRQSILERQDVGTVMEKHILAVNMDIVYICMSLNEDFNMTKLRNFLSLTYNQGFKTIILLTKKDLCDNINYYISQVKAATHHDIQAISAHDEDDIVQLKQSLVNQTAVFIGSSGVGKSTLINAMIGEDYFKINTIRMSDAQGRHTTVNRELIELEQGIKLIDTPGIRIVSSYFVSENEFDDIKALSEGCKYRNCSHTDEPGCMVQYALDTGALSDDRWQQYLKGMKRNAFNKQREIERERIMNKRMKTKYKKTRY